MYLFSLLLCRPNLCILYVCSVFFVFYYFQSNLLSKIMSNYFTWQFKIYCNCTYFVVWKLFYARRHLREYSYIYTHTHTPPPHTHAHTPTHIIHYTLSIIHILCLLRNVGKWL